MKSLRQSPAFVRLMSPISPWRKSDKERAEMTISCHDADLIPRVNDAGGTTDIKGERVQIMHNGLYVKKSGYQGEWQAETIKRLRGVHEPQEEKVFYEVLQRIKKSSCMIELGAWWAYYSMWYLKKFPNAKIICTEPDPVNIELGRHNFALNDLGSEHNVKFYAAASGSRKKKRLVFTNEDGSKTKVPIVTVDDIVEENNLDKIDILHMDIQGAELDALYGAMTTIKDNRLRFLFVSTHHYAISEDPGMHRKCVDYIVQNGGHIIAQHSVTESCSGDGLIVASFDTVDRQFTVDISRQDTEDSLFRSAERDVEILWHAYDKLSKQNDSLEEELQKTRESLAYHIEMLSEKNSLIEEITPLKKHIKRQLRRRLGGSQNND